MTARVVVTLSMLYLGWLVVAHKGVLSIAGQYLTALRAGTVGPTLALTAAGARWLLAWFILAVLLTAALDAGANTATLAMLFSLLLAASASYLWLPEVIGTSQGSGGGGGGQGAFTA